MPEVAEKVLTLLKEKRTTLSSKEIAAELFGPEKGYQQRVDEALRNLVREGRVERFGSGGGRQPYSYQIAPAKDEAQGEQTPEPRRLHRGGATGAPNADDLREGAIESIRRSRRALPNGIIQRVWLYAKESAKWAAESKSRDDQDLFFDMAKA